VSGTALWVCETNFMAPVNVSDYSSPEVRNVAAAFMTDIGEDEIRIKFNSTGATNFTSPGCVDGVYFNVNKGILEKGLPQLPFSGLAANNEGLACWNADGSGPEVEATGHIYSWNNIEYIMPYYVASRDYDGIDPNKNPATGHLIDELIGFPNLKIQLDYRGYTLDQLKLKTGLGSLGNDIEGIDWGIDGHAHWYNYYDFEITIEIANEPILQYTLDTNFCHNKINSVNNWRSVSSFSTLRNISNAASTNAQAVAASFIKDLSGHAISSYMEGNQAGYMTIANGRIHGSFQELENAKLIARQPAGTHVWESEAIGTWDLARSPFIVMGALEIPDGEVLIIEPGVEVKFNTTKAFGIYGSIKANGSAENPIIFTAMDEDIPWGGINIPNNSTTNEPISLKHCIFEHSYAYNPDNLHGYNCGGAIRVDNYEQIEISHCTFRHNSTDNFSSNNPCGGAIMINECSIHISHCIFHDNSSSWGGALAILDNSNPVIDNCLFYNNESTYTTGGGGAVLIWTESSPHFVNCTFADNYAVDAGGAVEVEINSTGTFTNSIFWGNIAGTGPSQISIWDLDKSKLRVLFSDVEGGLTGITPGFMGAYVENIDIDPQFIVAMGNLYVPNPLIYPEPEWLNGGTMISAFLPNDWECPDHCLCGNSRIIGSGIDMGCYESDVVTLNKLAASNTISFNVLPNPINSYPTIEFYLINESVVQISILDVNGKIISEMEAKEYKKGMNQITWNAGQMQAGLYFCMLRIGNKVSTTKFVKLN